MCHICGENQKETDELNTKIGDIIVVAIISTFVVGALIIGIVCF